MAHRQKDGHMRGRCGSSPPPRPISSNGQRQRHRRPLAPCPGCALPPLPGPPCRYEKVKEVEEYEAIRCVRACVCVCIYQ